MVRTRNVEARYVWNTGLGIDPERHVGEKLKEKGVEDENFPALFCVEANSDGPVTGLRHGDDFVETTRTVWRT